jgi:hypothetical protein
MTDPDAARLCQAARSVAPATCAERLDDTADLGRPSIVQYCGAPECIEAGDDETALSDTDLVDLLLDHRRDLAKEELEILQLLPVRCAELQHGAAGDLFDRYRDAANLRGAFGLGRTGPGQLLAGRGPRHGRARGHADGDGDREKLVVS